MVSKLYKKLIEYSKSDFYGFHMPGHKRNVEKVSMINPFSIDITEIDGFDNMHNPEETILDEMKKAAKFYGSDKSYFLVNGSTGGNMAAISAVAEQGDKVIVTRNCHKSVHNVMELRKLIPLYIYPYVKQGEEFFGETRVEMIEEAIKANPDARAVVITSPTYEGIVSDVEKISKLVHKSGMALIVDAAHGAHFTMSSKFPKSAVKCGADIVIESLHKTLPSLTQTAILHYKDYGFVSKEKLEKYLAMYQSSSPSYVMMSSICNCIDEISHNGEELGQQWIHKIELFRERTKSLKNISIYAGDDDFDFDKSKLIIIVKSGTFILYNNIGVDNSNIEINQKILSSFIEINENINSGIIKTDEKWHSGIININGKWLSGILRNKYHLEMEMQAGNYVIAMTSAYDTDEGMNRLANALNDIDEFINLLQNVDKYSDKRVEDIYRFRNKKACEVFEVEEYLLKCNKQHYNDKMVKGEQNSSLNQNAESVLRANKGNTGNKEKNYSEQNIYSKRNIGSIGSHYQVSDKYVYMYPPGIPLIVPGEIPNKELLECIEEYRQAGYEIIEHK